MLRGGPHVIEATTPDPKAAQLLATPAMERARRYLESTDGRTLEEQIALTEIPAPPFDEVRRGQHMAGLMTASGLEVLATDEVGNVIARGPGSAPWSGSDSEGRPIVVSAHLDTVFPPGTDTRVTRDGDLLQGPGISDDARGLAALLALARAGQAAGIEFSSPVLIVATVGEEGTGDLRGVRHLFSKDGFLSGGCACFFSLDGAGMRRIVNVGLGSLRYRATVRGPGGHSWVDFGLPNPIHALARAVDRITRVPLPTRPATTLSVGRWGGGTSVNAIPTEAWVELEVRSEAEVELSRMDLEVRSILDRVVAPQSSDLRGPRLTLDIETLGHRPAGATSVHHPLVQAAISATTALGERPELGISSTDANLPMSLGVPAITLGVGGEAGQAHTTAEWYRNTRGPDGILRALLALLLADEALGPPKLD
jgi:acetylornithine deacetylase/succinyl-diaminopimelate desuccinylase-like protein